MGRWKGGFTMILWMWGENYLRDAGRSCLGPVTLRGFSRADRGPSNRT
jgi:hypothetical protein